MPEDLLRFLAAPPGLGGAERVFYRGLSGAAAQLVSPTIAPFAAVPGRGTGGVVRLPVTRAQLRALQLALGAYSPSEAAARWRLDMGPAPDWARAEAA